MSYLVSFDPGSNLNAPFWKQYFRAAEASWITDHVVQDNILYPEASSICLAIDAMGQMVEIETQSADSFRQASRKPISGFTLQYVDILQALVVLDNSEGIEIHTIFRATNDKNVGLEE